MAEFKLTGGCHCGNVRYTITAPAVDTHNCHCSICRKIQGTVFVTHSLFPRSGVKFNKSEGLTSYDTSENVHRHFCSRCGCPISLDVDPFPDLIGITTGTIDNSAFPGHPKEVYRHAFWSSRVPWFEYEGVPKVDGFK